MQLYEHLYTNLPDPDKILEDNNYDYSILRDLLNDPHLMATIQQRKMQVMQMGWEIDIDEGNGKKDSNKNSKLKERTIEIMRDLPLAEIMNNILDAVYFGFSVGEIEWKFENNEIVPTKCKRKTTGVVYLQ